MPDKKNDDAPRVAYQTTRDPDAAHPLAAELPAVEAPKLSAEDKAAEKARAEAAPQTADPKAKPQQPVKTVDHEADWSGLSSKEVPRHDRYADENTPYPTPERVVPSTPTNANPSFADYPVVTQDRPGFADGTDAENVAEATGDKPREPKVSEKEPPGPHAGEGAWVVREPTKEATGASSPVGDAHNDPADGRVADSKAEADRYFEAKEERKAEEAGFTEPDAPRVEITEEQATRTTKPAQTGRGITSTASRRAPKE